MATKPPILSAFLDFCVAYVRSEGTAKGMKAKAAKHFGVDGRTVSRWLHDLRASKALGRGVFQKWRDSRD